MRQEISVTESEKEELVAPLSITDAWMTCAYLTRGLVQIRFSEEMVGPDVVSPEIGRGRKPWLPPEGVAKVVPGVESVFFWTDQQTLAWVVPSYGQGDGDKDVRFNIVLGKGVRSLSGSVLGDDWTVSFFSQRFFGGKQKDIYRLYPIKSSEDIKGGFRVLMVAPVGLHENTNYLGSFSVFFNKPLIGEEYFGTGLNEPSYEKRNYRNERAPKIASIYIHVTPPEHLGNLRWRFENPFTLSLRQIDGRHIDSSPRYCTVEILEGLPSLGGDTLVEPLKFSFVVPITVQREGTYPLAHDRSKVGIIDDLILNLSSQVTEEALSGSISLTDNDGVDVPVSTSIELNQVKITAAEPLRYDTRYCLEITGGYPVPEREYIPVSPYRSCFTTVAAPEDTVSLTLPGSSTGAVMSTPEQEEAGSEASIPPVQMDAGAKGTVEPGSGQKRESISAHEKAALEMAGKGWKAVSSVPLLIEMIAEEGGENSDKALNALREMGPPAFYPLLRYVRESGGWKRDLLYELLREMEPPEVLEELLAEDPIAMSLADESSDRRSWALASSDWPLEYADSKGGGFVPRWFAEKVRDYLALNLGASARAVVELEQQMEECFKPYWSLCIRPEFAIEPRNDVYCRPPKNMEFLVEAIKDSEGKEIAQVLRDMSREQAILFLRIALKYDPEGDNRELTTGRLSGIPEATEDLVEALDDNDGSVRARAMDALVKGEQKISGGSLEKIKALMSWEKNDYVGNMAIVYMREVMGIEVPDPNEPESDDVDSLLAILEKGPKRQSKNELEEFRLRRIKIVEKLNEIGDPKAVPYLVKGYSLHDQAARNALISIGTEEACLTLARMAVDETSSYQHAAKTLARSECEVRLDQFIDLLPEAKGQKAGAVLKVLGKMGDRRTAEQLLDIYLSTGEMREGIFEALGQLKSPVVAHRLAFLAERSRDDEEIKAIWGCLEKTGPYIAPDAFIRPVFSHAPDVKTPAVSALVKWNDVHALEPVLPGISSFRYLSKKDKDLLLRNLGADPDKDTLVRLALMEGPFAAIESEETREFITARVLEYLAEENDPSLESIFQEFLEAGLDKDFVLFSAAWGLLKMEDERCVSPLLDLADSGNVEVKNRIGTLLEDPHSSLTLSFARMALNHRKKSVVEKAVACLQGNGNPEIRALIDAAGH